MIMLELDGELATAEVDMGPPGRPPLDQPGIYADDFPDRPLARVGAGTCSEPHPQRVAEMLLQGGVVGLRRGNLCLEQHPAVDRQPPPIQGLHLVRHRDMGVQIRVAGPAVAVAERSPHQATHVHLPDPLRSGPGEQGLLLDEAQRVVDRDLMGPFDRRRHRRFGDRPQRRHRLHRRKRQIETGHCLRPRPRVFRDLGSQLGSINRGPAMLSDKELPSYLGPNPRPVSCRNRGVDRLPDRGIQRSDPLGHLERRRIVDDLERCPQPHDVTEVPFSEVGALQLLQPCLGRRMQPHPNKARICSAVTGSPTSKPSIPAMPEPTHTPGDSPRSV
jgi:hypothetical protein